MKIQILSDHQVVVALTTTAQITTLVAGLKITPLTTIQMTTVALGQDQTTTMMMIKAAVRQILAAQAPLLIKRRKRKKRSSCTSLRPLNQR